VRQHHQQEHRHLQRVGLRERRYLQGRRVGRQHLQERRVGRHHQQGVRVQPLLLLLLLPGVRRCRIGWRQQKLRRERLWRKEE
jgi:hypothetical protein